MLKTIRAGTMGIPHTAKTFRVLAKYKSIYFMLAPVLLYYLIFHYIPMLGIVISFKDYSPAKGILESPWVGLDNFYDFFGSYYVIRLIRNTLMINLYELIFAFPAPIIFALMLNEIRKEAFKRTIQTLTYLPHFISTVVAVGIIMDFMSSKGVINHILGLAGVDPIPFMTTSEWFYPIYVASDIWQHLGWESIVYLAALSAIDPLLYEASIVDGAGRWKQMIHITLPGIAPIVIILLVLQIGKMMSVGFEKVMLMYNSSIYDTADVISTFVYRKGLLESDYSYSTTVGLFNSTVNFILLVTANKISRNLSESSLW